MGNLDWTQTTKNDMVSYYQGQYGNKISYEAEATIKYNCHNWAWDGSTTVWMDPPRQYK